LTNQLAELEKGDTLRIVSRADGQLYVEFIDSGDGLAEEELEDLFALRRFDGSCARNLGLIAARGLVELNEGSLEVESREGMGTRFSVVLPID
jgi:signal transduction histidine kinase